MSRSTTRKAIIRMYEECKKCPRNISGYGKCKEGYDNFYYRKNKDNGCKKCKGESSDVF